MRKRFLPTAFFLLLFLITGMMGFPQNQPTGHLNADSLKKQALLIKKANRELAAKTNYQYFIIKADSSTYGYSIYANGQQYIWQTTIPAMPGNKGFATEGLATKCARLVIQKIKQGEMPPTIIPGELKKLKVI